MIRPNDDFYMWQNKKWLDDPSNAIPSDYSNWGSFTKLYDESIINLLKILKDISNKEYIEDSNEKILAQIFRKSEEKFLSWEKGEGNYQNILNKFKFLNELDLENYSQSLAKIGAYFKVNSISFPIVFGKSEDLFDCENVRLDISGSDFSLPERDYYFDEKFKGIRDNFMNHLNNIKNILNLSDNFSVNVFNFEKKIAYHSMKSEQKREYETYFTKTTLTNFYENIGALKTNSNKLKNYGEDKKIRNWESLLNEEKEKIKSFMETFYSELKLREFLERNYENNFEKSNSDSEIYTLLAYDGDYFLNILPYILDMNNKEEIISYLQYCIIKSESNYCTKELNEEIFDFYSRKISGQETQKPYEKQIIARINLWANDVLGQVYVKNYFSEESKKELEKMIGYVLDTMKTSLTNNDWLTEGTKQKALEKLSTFKMKIGYPDKWRDFSTLNFTDGDSLNLLREKINKFWHTEKFLNKINSKVDRNEWAFPPQTVNAYYDPQQNEIVFPAAILQPPFYTKSLSDVDPNLDLGNFENYNPLIPINHGGIVAVIAHEVTHGYDDQGRKFDSTGNMTDWWTDEDIKLFNNKASLMEDQVNIFEFKDSKGQNHFMNSKLTMGENLADLGGLTLALNSMLYHPDYCKDSISPFNNNEAIRLFFKSWGNIWKRNIKEELKIQYLISDPHAPAEFRGNLVKNIDEFYKAFSISENDKMYLSPNKRVKMW